MEPQAFSPAGCLAFGDGFFYSLQHITYNFFIHTALRQLPLVLSIQFLITALLSGIDERVPGLQLSVLKSLNGLLHCSLVSQVDVDLLSPQIGKGLGALPVR